MAIATYECLRAFRSGRLPASRRVVLRTEQPGTVLDL